MNIINLHFQKPKQLAPAEIRRRFNILAKAYSLGLFETDATVRELFEACYMLTPEAINDIIAKTVLAEGPQPKPEIGGK